jgi:hypothetical protein
MAPASLRTGEVELMQPESVRLASRAKVVQSPAICGDEIIPFIINGMGGLPGFCPNFEQDS